MNDILVSCVKVAGYIGCLGAGALISWYFTKKHYEALVDEEIQSIREVHNREENESVQKNNDKNGYYNVIGQYVYDDMPSGYVNDTHKLMSKKDNEPYLIPMETFDDADPAYEKISLEYYTEDDCLVENDEIIDPSSSVGVENLKRFAKRMDLIVMYVRNENIGVDYEVTKIISKWSE